MIRTIVLLLLLAGCDKGSCFGGNFAQRNETNMSVECVGGWDEAIPEGEWCRIGNGPFFKAVVTADSITCYSDRE
jgi:hypothetical protein